MVMSLTALAVLLGSIAASSGVVRETDEGAIAHIWQLLMAGQLPILAYFVIRHLGIAPTDTQSVGPKYCEDPDARERLTTVQMV
jgi:hypothetical protein